MASRATAPMATDLGAQLAAIRRQAGLTQTQLGLEILMSASAVSRIETGRVGAVRVSVIEAWAHACRARLSIVVTPQVSAGARA